MSLHGNVPHLSPSPPGYFPVSWEDDFTRNWVQNYSPEVWHGRVLMQFCWVRFDALQPAGSLKWPEMVSAYAERLRRGQPIPPPVVCRAHHGRLYLHDGNHRFEALQAYFGPHAPSQVVRVGLVIPQSRWKFEWVQYPSYGTYELIQVSPQGAESAGTHPQAGELLQQFSAAAS